MGQRTRTRLLEVAVELFTTRGPDVAVTAIAAEADCYPSQVTYYFGSKEALLVEAACHELVHLGARAEETAAASPDARAYIRILVEVVAPAPALSLIIEAMALARRRPELAPMIAEAFDRIHHEGARAYAAQQTQFGWAQADAVVGSKRFWTLALGVSLRIAATGGDPHACVSEMLAVLNRGEVKGEAK
jgi:AcrR family transcriptional regulator